MTLAGSSTRPSAGSDSSSWPSADVENDVPRSTRLVVSPATLDAADRLLCNGRTLLEGEQCVVGVVDRQDHKLEEPRHQRRQREEQRCKSGSAERHGRAGGRDEPFRSRSPRALVRTQLRAWVKVAEPERRVHAGRALLQERFCAPTHNVGGGGRTGCLSAQRRQAAAKCIAVLRKLLSVRTASSVDDTKMLRMNLGGFTAGGRQLAGAR